LTVVAADSALASEIGGSRLVLIAYAVEYRPRLYEKPKAIAGPIQAGSYSLAPAEVGMVSNCTIQWAYYTPQRFPHGIIRVSRPQKIGATPMNAV
jgi:hypothetical protein